MTELNSKERNRSVSRKQRNSRFCETIKGTLLGAMLLFRYYIDLFIDKLFGFFYSSKKQSVGPTNDPLLLESASAIALKIRKREVKVETVVKAFIQRIKEVNSVLNAVVDERFDEAIKEAKEIDKAIETLEITDVDFQSKPFLGVPFTSKESTLAKGMSCTFGTYARKGRKASEDSEIVRLVKEAGGILLGVTNIPQLNMWQETNNPLFGQTNNPYNTTRNVGGSSGGEASILAACGSAIGLGTDIGGSLRIPAFMCGIFGHKPTSDVINTRGMTFRTGKEKNTMVVAGPMARYSEDLIPLLKVLANDNASKLKLNTHVNLNDIVFYYIEDPEDPFISPRRDDMKNAFSSVIHHLNEILPNKPKKVEFKGTKYGGKLWRYWMTKEENTNFIRDLTDRQSELNPVTEIIKYIFMQRNLSLSTIFNMINQLLPSENEKWAVEESKKLREEILEKLGDDGVLLYPSAPWPASYHYTAFFRPWNFNLFAIWNALKLPVTQIPLGLNSEGLPLGIQAVAAPYNDRLTLAVAKHLEKQFGGYVPPFELKL